MDDQNLTWKPKGYKNIFSTRIFDIREVKSLSPEAIERTFYTLHSPDWVIVVPVLRNPGEEESFLMVRQWRHGTETLSMEFPGGAMDEGETPAETAVRELREETGYRAARLELAASLSPNPAIMDNRCHIFIAEDLERVHELDLDDDEFLSAESVPVGLVMRNMGHGSYQHALMAASLFLYMQKKGLSTRGGQPDTRFSDQEF